jgi:hypothetical protein
MLSRFTHTIMERLQQCDTGKKLSKMWIVIKVRFHWTSYVLFFYVKTHTLVNLASSVRHRKKTRLLLHHVTLLLFLDVVKIYTDGNVSAMCWWIAIKETSNMGKRRLYF